MLGVFRLRRLEYIDDKLADISVDQSFVFRVILIQVNMMPILVLLTWIHQLSPLSTLIIARSMAVLVKLRSVLRPVKAVLLFKMETLKDRRHLIRKCLSVPVRKGSGVLHKADKIVGHLARFA